MTWVRRTEPKPEPHRCSLPIRISGWVGLVKEPVGQRGELFRCDHCGRLWRVGWLGDRPAWRPAWWWQRLRYRHRPDSPIVVDDLLLDAPPPDFDE